MDTTSNQRELPEGHRTKVSAEAIREELSGSLVRRTSRVFELAKSGVLLAIVILTIHSLLATVSIVDGPSMLPTYSSGDAVLVDRRDWQQYAQGDVVVLRYPGDPDGRQYIKRIVAVPGDEVSVANGHVIVNQRPLTESYLPRGLITQPDVPGRVLDEDEYYTLGDNRPVSNDSRFFGPVQRRFIVGRVVTTLFTTRPSQ